MKTCTKCKKPKPLDSFYRVNKGQELRRGSCKVCTDQVNAVYTTKNVDAVRAQAREYSRSYRVNPENTLKHNLYKRHGLSVGQYLSMKIAQCNKCAICKEPFGRAYVDHDHQTGKIRGLLCLQCNTALGSFRDSPERLQAAIRYLNNL